MVKTMLVTSHIPLRNVHTNRVFQTNKHSDCVATHLHSHNIYTIHSLSDILIRMRAHLHVHITRSDDVPVWSAIYLRISQLSNSRPPKIRSSAFKCVYIAYILRALMSDVAHACSLCAHYCAAYYEQNMKHV